MPEALSFKYIFFLMFATFQNFIEIPTFWVIIFYTRVFNIEIRFNILSSPILKVIICMGVNEATSAYCLNASAYGTPHCSPLNLLCFLQNREN